MSGHSANTIPQEQKKRGNAGDISICPGSNPMTLTGTPIGAGRFTAELQSVKCEHINPRKDILWFGVACRRMRRGLRGFLPQI